jgi:beta-lactam-binding protein with PASTA domain
MLAVVWLRVTAALDEDGRVGLRPGCERITKAVAISAFAIAVALLGAGCGGSASVEVPSNHGHRLDDALRRLHKVGLRASYAGMRTPCGGGLPQVTIQSPRAPARVSKNSVVTMKLFGGPIPSPGGPLHHQRWATVPDLVGKDAASAAESLRMMWGCLHLRAASGTDGSRLVVVQQRPPAGTRVPAYGVRSGHAYRPTTVDLYIAAR